MKRILSIIVVVGLICFTAFSVVHAQDATIDLTLNTVPLDPQPQQQVTVTAQSYGTDLSQAFLVWKYNGKIIASDTGRTQITIVTPVGGQTGTLVVTASGGNFATTTATLVLRPASVDLLWEGADSYTPPFYKGRALPSTGGIIRVVAIPSISAPRQLSFNWTRNDDAQPASSGYNKSSFTFHNDDLIPTEQIKVTEQSSTYSGSSSVTITPGDPSIVGYVSSDGYIDYDNGSTSTLASSGTGAIIHFEPYFFSIPNSIPQNISVSYTDSAKNSLPQGDTENEIRLSRPAGGGLVSFNVIMSTVQYSLQNLSRLFRVNFN